MSEINKQRYEGSNQLLIEAQRLRDMIASSNGVEKIDLYYRLAVTLQRVDTPGSLAAAEEGLEYGASVSGNTADSMALLWLNKAMCYFYMAEIVAAEDSLKNIWELLGTSSEAVAAVRAENLHGVIDIERGRYVAALNHYDKAYTTSVRQGYRMDEFNSLVNMGNAYNRLEQTPKALETYLRGLAVAEELGEKKLKAKVLGNIATTYAHVDEFEKEMEYCQAAFQLHTETGDLLGQSLVLANMGYANFRMENYTDAYKYYQQTIAIKQEIGDIEHQPVSWMWLGLSCDKLGLEDEAFAAMNRSLEISLNNGAMFKHAMALNGLAELLTSRGRYIEALEAIDKCVAVCREHNYTMPIETALRNRYEILKQESRWQEATETAEEVLEVTAEISKRQSALQRETMQAIYDLDAARAAAQLERRRNEELAAKDKLLQQRNAELERLNEDKNELLRIVAHDLKNPLSSIAMIAKLLQNDDYINHNERLELFDDILTTSERMFILINDLLNLEELERGTLRFQKERVSANEMLASVCRQNRKYADAKNITLNYHPANDEVILIADEGRLRQLIENLLSNALKFSPHGSSVQLSVERRTEKGRITVKDHGPGITEADKERLFQKFARLSARPTGDEHSTGLGLAIAKRITEAMGGDISCESNVGFGAAFIVELPLFQN